ncbi:MAG: UTP--glucose-1-phosphate uridylyltransferase, partial [Bacteroidota bacterium]
AAAFIRDNAEAEVYGLMGYTLKDTLSVHGSVSRGVCKRDGKRLISVEERLKLEQQSNKVVDLDTGLEFNGDELVSMNFWVCRPSIFEHIEGDLRTFMQNEETQKTGEVYLPFVVQAMLQQDKVAVEVIPSESKWFGVTYADDKDRAVAQLQEMTGEGAYSSPLWAKVPS